MSTVETSAVVVSENTLDQSVLENSERDTAALSPAQEEKRHRGVLKSLGRIPPRLAWPGHAGVAFIFDMVDVEDCWGRNIVPLDKVTVVSLAIISATENCGDKRIFAVHHRSHEGDGDKIAFTPVQRFDLRSRPEHGRLTAREHLQWFRIASRLDEMLVSYGKRFHRPWGRFVFHEPRPRLLRYGNELAVERVSYWDSWPELLLAGQVPDAAQPSGWEERVLVREARKGFPLLAPFTGHYEGVLDRPFDSPNRWERENVKEHLLKTQFGQELVWPIAGSTPFSKLPGMTFHAGETIGHLSEPLDVHSWGHLRHAWPQARQWFFLWSWRCRQFLPIGQDGERGVARSTSASAHGGEPWALELTEGVTPLYNHSCGALICPGVRQETDTQDVVELPGRMTVRLW